MLRSPFAHLDLIDQHPYAAHDNRHDETYKKCLVPMGSLLWIGLGYRDGEFPRYLHATMRAKWRLVANIFSTLGTLDDCHRYRLNMVFVLVIYA